MKGRVEILLNYSTKHEHENYVFPMTSFIYLIKYHLTIISAPASGLLSSLS